MRNLSSVVHEQQRGRPAYASAQSVQCLCYSLIGSITSRLTTTEISILQLVSVAEQAGLNLILSEAPKTGFLALRPKNAKHFILFQ